MCSLIKHQALDPYLEELVLSSETHGPAGYCKSQPFFVQLVLISRCIRGHVPLFNSCGDYILSWRWASKLKSLCSSETGCSQGDKILFGSLVTFSKMCMRRLRISALTENCLHGCKGVVGRPREYLRFTEKRPS